MLLWVEKGWLDYCVPQIYWEIGNRAADYKTLINWWAAHADKRHLYIGEDVERTVKNSDPQRPSQHQQEAKHLLHQQLQPAVKGTVLWYAKAVVDNVGGYGDQLRTRYWRTPTLQPTMSYISKTAPRRVKKLKAVWTSDGYMLFWTAPRGKDWKHEARQYVVYRFAKGEKVNTDDAAHIVAVTPNTFYKLPYEYGKAKYTYVVTALDRLHNESKTRKRNVSL